MGALHIKAWALYVDVSIVQGNSHGLGAKNINGKVHALLCITS